MLRAMLEFYRQFSRTRVSVERRGSRPVHASEVAKTTLLPKGESWKLKKPTRCAVWWAENEPVSDGGNPPRPIRLFRMTEHRTQDIFASRVPVHSALVQKSVTTSTNSAGRLSPWMLGNGDEIRKRKMQNSWQEVC